MTWLYLLKNKSEVVERFLTFHNMIKTQFSATLQVFRSDNGGEFVNKYLQGYFKEHGILHETTCVDTPQQNGVAERKNRHILEITRASLIGANMKPHWWEEAITTAVYLLNRVPTSVLNFQTPSDKLATYMDIPSHLTIPPRVFGCVAFVNLQKHLRTKLDPCALKCVFVGYHPFQKGYRCYHPTTRKFYVSMDVTFSEHEMFYASSILHSHLPGESHSVEEVNWLKLFPDNMVVVEIDSTGTLEKLPEVAVVSGEIIPVESKSKQIMELGQNSDVIDAANEPSLSSSIVPMSNPPQTDISEVSRDSAINTNNISESIDSDRYQLPPRSNRGVPAERFSPEPIKKPKYPIAHYVSTHRLSESSKSFINDISTMHIPTKVSEALLDVKWAAAMKEEMTALQKNKTWELVSLPEGKKLVGCRWVFTIKQNPDGSIDKCKAILLARGFTQTHGVDYNETFAPVAKINTIRVLLSLAANLDWHLQQYDVKNAFLHGDLKEEVYMSLPPGYDAPRTSGSVVCRLKKALYGLKQSPRAWFGRFRFTMKKYGYKQSDADHTLFLKKVGDKITVLIIYVDDMIVTGNDLTEMSKLKDYLSSEFDMKDLGRLKYFLGIEVNRSKQGIFVSQRKYVLDLLGETGMLGCEPIKSPIEKNHGLEECPDQTPVNKERYQRLVGRLIYLSHTRPDIAYAVSVVSRFMHNPSKQHMDAVVRILRYLKSAPGKGLLFSKHGNTDILGYSYSDWAGKGDRRSTSGYLTFVGGNLVTWKSKKQKVVSLSSAEAEYRAMVKGICELLWLKRLMGELGFSSEKPMKLFCDNQSAIKIAENPVQHDRTKHVEIDRNFIYEKLENKEIEVPYVSTKGQLADMLTKAQTNSAFSNSLVKLGIYDIYAPP